MFSFLPVARPSDIDTHLQNRIVVGTGHRPKHTGGYSEYARQRLIHLATDWLTGLKPRGVISGLALGWDTALIEACLALKIPYVACAPFPNQASKWPLEARQRHERYVAGAAKYIVCSPGEFSPAKMQIRNDRMIQLACKKTPIDALLLALWNGSPGGTTNCLDYAARQKIKIINTWQNFLEYTLPEENLR